MNEPINSTATPPLLAIRPGTSFWIHDADPLHATVTLQAFLGGCFDNALFVDRSGGAWPVVDATLSENPAAFDRMLPWQRLPVTLRLGDREDISLREVLEQLESVLQGSAVFTDHLRLPPAELLGLLRDADSISAVIEIIQTRA